VTIDEIRLGWIDRDSVLVMHGGTISEREARRRMLASGAPFKGICSDHLRAFRVPPTSTRVDEEERA
jgi:hypothetical protein